MGAGLHVSLQTIPVGFLWAALPAWGCWEFTIWHRRKRGILPPTKTRRNRAG